MLAATLGADPGRRIVPGALSPATGLAEAVAAGPPGGVHGPEQGRNSMALGSGIFLIVIGAIAAFAVDDAIEGVDLGMIGYICMAAGVVAIVISLIANQQRSNTSHTEIRDEHVDEHRVEK